VRLNLGAAPEDFFVEELPAYPFEGAGEHLCLLVEKRGLTTDALVRAVARACRAKVGEIGVAGRKDRHAVTRQWLTVRGAGDAEVPAIEAELGPAARVLEVARHRTKLRLGHLAGNRFVLRLYGDAQASSGARAALEASLARVARDGLRNRFDTQRFGVAGATLALARAWGARDFEAAVRFVVDPEGTWQPSDPVPERALVSGPQARVASAWQRRPGHARAALGTAARDLRPLAASAAQAAVFKCARHGQQLGGGSPLHNLMEVKC
jgi:tRNA pseudouridine13 synthase